MPKSSDLGRSESLRTTRFRTNLYRGRGRNGYRNRLSPGRDRVAYTVRAEPTEYAVVGIDPDADSDSDPEARTFRPQDRSAERDDLVRRWRWCSYRNRARCGAGKRLRQRSTS